VEREPRLCRAQSIENIRVRADWSEDGRRHHTVVDPRNNSVSHDDIPIDARFSLDRTI
jgi:hypothetical protein